LNTGLIDKGHLTDDYVMSRNIAEFGFKHATLKELLPQIGLPGAEFFWHVYTIPVREKIEEMHKVLRRWKIPKDLMNVC
jgi:hypothetical protein